MLKPDNVYIGRGTQHLKSSEWANPFPIGPENTRSQAVHRYEGHILSNIELLESLSELRGKKLGYWCAPLQCHGEILHNLAGNRPIYQNI